MVATALRSMAVVIAPASLSMVEWSFFFQPLGVEAEQLGFGVNNPICSSYKFYLPKAANIGIAEAFCSLAA